MRGIKEYFTICEAWWWLHFALGLFCWLASGNKTGPEFNPIENMWKNTASPGAERIKALLTSPTAVVA